MKRWSRRRALWALCVGLWSHGVEAGYREDSIVDFMERMREGELEAHESRVGALHDTFLDTSLGRDRRLVSLALGVQYVERNPRLALQYLSSAELSCREGDPLLPIVRYYLAQARLNSGAYQEALSISESLLRTDADGSWNRLIHATVIEAAFGSGDYDKLIEAFDEYSKSFSFSRRQEHLAHLAAVALEKKGDLERATAILEGLARGYPTTEESRWAFNRLLDLSCDQGKSDRPRYYMSAQLLLDLSRNAILGTGLRELILGSLHRPLRQQDDSIRVMSLAERARFLFKAQFFKESLEATRERYDSERAKQDSAELPEITFDLGRTHLRLWEPTLAARYFSQFLADYPRHPNAPRAQEFLGDALRNAGLPAAAAESYAGSQAQSDSPLIRWHHFWNTYRAKQYDSAISLLERPGYVLPREGDDAVTVTYWHARVLERLGRKAEADAKLTEILTTKADSYYANLVAAIRPDLLARPAVAAAKPAESRKGFALAARPLISEPPPGGTGPASRPELRLIDELLKVGMTDAAKVQLAGLKWAAFGQSDSFTAISRLALVLDDYNPSRRIRYSNFSALRALPANWWDLQKHQAQFSDEWKVYYPMAYDKVVSSVASKIRLNPFLVLSIMRTESFYNKDARSGVGAQGLMQLMPYTAMKIAQLLDHQNFDAQDLGKPEVNIGYGAYYLDKLLRYYGDNPFVAAAAYNGGPVAVNQWLGSCDGCDADEFVESIQYRETRRYVREVMRTYAQYIRIYSGQQALTELPPMPTELPDGEEIF